MRRMQHNSWELGWIRQHWEGVHTLPLQLQHHEHALLQTSQVVRERTVRLPAACTRGGKGSQCQR